MFLNFDNPAFIPTSSLLKLPRKTDVCEVFEPQLGKKPLGTPVLQNISGIMSYRYDPHLSFPTSLGDTQRSLLARACSDHLEQGTAAGTWLRSGLGLNRKKTVRQCSVPAALTLWAVLSCPAPDSFSWEILSTPRDEEYSVLLMAVCSCNLWEAAVAIPWIPFPCFKAFPWSSPRSAMCSRAGLHI